MSLGGNVEKSGFSRLWKPWPSVKKRELVSRFLLR